MPGTVPRRALLAAPLLLPGIARAQGRFPDRPIRLIVPYTAGGNTDAQARALCEAMAKQLGQSVVAENRGGGGGIQGAQLLAAGTRPDGYTLAQMPVSVFRHPHMMARPAFDPLVDFTYIIQTTGYNFGCVLKADTPLTSMEKVVAFARANPGGFTYATTGVGSSMHMTLETVAQHHGVEFTHVPFRGAAESYTALLGGQIMANATSDWARMSADGVVRLLFTTGAEPPRRFPQARTLRMEGIDLVVTSPYGMAGPKGMDPEVVRILHDAIRAALADPAYLAVIERLDMTVEYLDTAAYTASARRQVAEEAEVVRRFNLRQG